jgi:hypothetical protein
MLGHEKHRDGASCRLSASSRYRHSAPANLQQSATVQVGCDSLHRRLGRQYGKTCKIRGASATGFALSSALDCSSKALSYLRAPQLRFLPRQGRSQRCPADHVGFAGYPPGPRLPECICSRLVPRLSAMTGTLNEKTEPLPRSDSTHIRPPSSSMMRLDIANPSPVPPFFLVIELSACWNSWNSFA